jgi:hypothetical protein
VNIQVCDIELVKYRPLAAEHLDLLGWVIADTDLTAVTRYAEVIPLLRVSHPALPCMGESVSAMPMPDGKGANVWWFMLPIGGLLTPCSDLAGTVERLYTVLAPIFQAADGRRSLRGI